MKHLYIHPVTRDCFKIHLLSNQFKENNMKNLKKMSRSALKSITGGDVVCPMPSGVPALCPGTKCPINPCLVPNCRVSIQDCGSPVIW